MQQMSQLSTIKLTTKFLTVYLFICVLRIFLNQIQVEGTAVGFMSISDDVNCDLLNECFELGPFHGLRKPHQDDELTPSRTPVPTPPPGFLLCLFSRVGMGIQKMMWQKKCVNKSEYRCTECFIISPFNVLIILLPIFKSKLSFVFVIYISDCNNLKSFNTK